MFTTMIGQDTLGEGAINAIIWSFTSLAIVTTAIRLYARHFIVKAVGLDDILITCGQVIAIGLAAIATWHSLLVLRMVNVKFKTNNLINTTFLSGFITDALHILTLPIIKCSILAFYKRIVPSRRQRLLLYFIALFILIQSFIFLMLLIFALDPAKAWLKVVEIKHTPRHNTFLIQIINSAFQVLYDIILLLLPLPLIIKTKFRGRDQAGIFIIYMFCCVSLVATIIRLKKATNISEELRVPGGNQRTTYVYWTIIEVMTAVTCANIPAMSSYFRHISQNTLRRSSKSRISERSSNLLQTVLKKGPQQNHHDASEKVELGDEEASSQLETSEKKQNVTTNDYELSRHSCAEESSCKSQNSLSHQKGDSNPTKRASSGFLANFSSRIISLLPFKKENFAKANPSAEVGTASRPVGGSGAIYRTYEFGVERSMV